jgi:hypothetical protein
MITIFSCDEPAIVIHKTNHASRRELYQEGAQLTAPSAYLVHLLYL